MQRYLTKADVGGSRRHETYRDADTPKDAAEQAARGLHSTYWVKDEPSEGKDLDGPYLGFTVVLGVRPVGVVRVRTP